MTILRSIGIIKRSNHSFYWVTTFGSIEFPASNPGCFHDIYGSSLVHICRKNQRIIPFLVREWMCEKTKV